MRRLLQIAFLAVAGLFAARRLRAPRTGAQAVLEAPPPHPWKPRLKRWGIELGVLLALLGVGGFLVAASGIVPIKASSGHWGITEWFLQFSKHRSVATHTLGKEAPPLDHPGLVLRGAGHYETGCRPCHGSPDFPYPRIAQHMTATPPYLPHTIPDWEPEELFYIVKHGIKLTGMPAWPAQQRDDEVWAMVAFLQTLPDLEATDYRALVDGEAGPSKRPDTTGAVEPLEDLTGPEDVPRAVAESCGRCHGADGLGREPGAFPRLAGQRPTYLYAALQAYARGTRHSGVMGPVAAALSREEMRTLARYYGNLDAPAPPPPSQDALPSVARGRIISQQGIPRQRVPSCADCHGPGATRRNPYYPILAGQDADYLVLQLELFNQEHRGGSSYAHLMHPVATRLTPEQMRDVARYYASLSATAGPPAADDDIQERGDAGR